MIRIRLQTQSGQLLADTQCDERGGVAIELSDGHIYLPAGALLQGLPIEQPLQLVVTVERPRPWRWLLAPLSQSRGA